MALVPYSSRVYADDDYFWPAARYLSRCVLMGNQSSFLVPPFAGLTRGRCLLAPTGVSSAAATITVMVCGVAILQWEHNSPKECPLVVSDEWGWWVNQRARKKAGGDKEKKAHFVRFGVYYIHHPFFLFARM